MLLSPACGPAPVTKVPLTSTAASVRPVSAVRVRSGAGTRSRGIPSSGWPTLTSNCTATHTIVIDTSKWVATVHHSSPVSTVMPPITAWATVEAGISQA